MGKGNDKLPPPTFEGIVYIEDRPHARISILGGGLLCVQTSDPDWLAELAREAKRACGALLHERSRAAHAVAQQINEETSGAH